VNWRSQYLPSVGATSLKRRGVRRPAGYRKWQLHRLPPRVPPLSSTRQVYISRVSVNVYHRGRPSFISPLSVSVWAELSTREGARRYVPAFKVGRSFRFNHFPLLASP
jgi:hypothetical protein